MAADVACPLCGRKVVRYSVRAAGGLWDGSLLDWARKVEFLGTAPAVPAAAAVADGRVEDAGDNRYRVTCDQTGCTWTLVARGETLRAAVVNQIILSMTSARGRVPKVPTVRGDEIGLQQRSVGDHVGAVALSLLVEAGEPLGSGRPTTGFRDALGLPSSDGQSSAAP
jgi:hypothetical protein